jgi:hypothetical protein
MRQSTQKVFQRPRLPVEAGNAQRSLAVAIVMPKIFRHDRSQVCVKEAFVT